MTLFVCLPQMTAPQWQNLEQREAYQRLVETVAVLHRLATRLSSRAEVVGAVRQVRLNKHTQVTVQPETTQECLVTDTSWCTHKVQLILWKIVPSSRCLRAGGVPFWQHFENDGEDGFCMMSWLTLCRPKQT